MPSGANRYQFTLCRYSPNLGNLCKCSIYQPIGYLYLKKTKTTPEFLFDKKGFTRSGNSAIMRVLMNPVYAGLLRLPAYNGEQEKLVKALHPLIISEADFWIVNDRLNNQPKYRTRPREDFPLRGIVKCDCG
jgi:hypothetical protein